jgi:hypothetical protein
MRPVNSQQQFVAGQPNPVKPGDIAFARMEKVNGELLAITYGALVSQMMSSDAKENISDVQASLEKVGYNMGIRLVDEFLAKNTLAGPCQTFADSMDVLSRIAIKMFLGIDTDLQEVSPKIFRITFAENPLNDFVELPSNLISGNFSYSTLYCGIIRGAFEQLHMNVRCSFLKDVLRGDEINMIEVELLGLVKPDDGE